MRIPKKMNAAAKRRQQAAERSNYLVEQGRSNLTRSPDFQAKINKTSTSRAVAAKIGQDRSLLASRAKEKIIDESRSSLGTYKAGLDNPEKYKLTRAEQAALEEEYLALTAHLRAGGRRTPIKTAVYNNDGMPLR